MNLPTTLTLSRIVAIPILLICYYLPFEWAHLLTAILFLLCAFTDWLDGYLARSWSQMTSLGEFLDPVADKLVVSVVIIMIVGECYSRDLVMPAAVIIGREITISALRQWMSEIGKRKSVAVSWLGKVKTTLQMTALTILLLYKSRYPLWFLQLGEALFYAAAALTLWSMVNYLKVVWQDLTLSVKQ